MYTQMPLYHAAVNLVFIADNDAKMLKMYSPNPDFKVIQYSTVNISVTVEDRDIFTMKDE